MRHAQAPGSPPTTHRHGVEAKLVRAVVETGALLPRLLLAWTRTTLPHVKMQGRRRIIDEDRKSARSSEAEEITIHNFTSARRPRERQGRLPLYLLCLLRFALEHVHHFVTAQVASLFNSPCRRKRFGENS